MRRWFQQFGTISLVLVLSGCGSGDDAKLYPVRGKVTLDGVAIEGATVTFVPTDSTPGAEATGRTTSDGSFELTSRSRKGAAAGTYKVIISRWLQRDGSPLPPGVAPIDSDASETLHPSYSDPDRTVLTAIVAEGSGPLDFPLSKSGKKVP